MDDNAVPLVPNGKDADQTETDGSNGYNGSEPARGTFRSADKGQGVESEAEGNGQDPAQLPIGKGLELTPTAEGNGHDQAATPTIAVPLSAQVEAVLFVTDGPVALADLAKALHESRDAVGRAITQLAGGYDGRRGLRLQRTNGLVQLVSAPETASAVASFIGLERSSRLSRAALETLSIVAYRQPVTRPEIDELRGVDSDAVVRSLAARGLIEPIGRRDTVGHPIEHATTFLFLEYFGLSGLDDLPSVERDGLSSPSDIDD